MAYGLRSGTTATWTCWAAPTALHLHCGEVAVEIGPLGIIYIDDAINLPEFGLVYEAVRLTVEEGGVVAIEGGEGARRLEEKLESYDDSEIFRIAELGIGLNPKAELIWDPLIDEGVLGTAHIALGLNYTYGGAIRDAKAHIDCVFGEPTIVLDGKILLRDGKLVEKT